ncbi:MAG: chromosome segregation protein SMC [Faecalibacterium sp.]|nr:chromosome segregation protein SMC [Ruminococcus sp.]MCM1486494.1 chromosome segregation protein SMC [Faecalibacterium sp.]
MILTALEMQGFKSFPEKTTLNFGKGITAVVGPNGSGKSNISDAVRWVLGEQSTKSLRGSKMEDVIFDGTRVRKAYGFAQVTLRLDNKDRSIKSVDEDEVSVTRRYFRSGESEYKINGKPVRLRDVHELFMDTGLGRDGYSMVSQGRISDMISGKGNQCREMLEEASGISAYRYRRSDSLKRLAQAEDNLIRLRDILAELEGRIGPLKTQSEKAQKFLVLADERKTLEIGLWLYNIDKLREELRKHEDNILVADGHYEQVEKDLAEIESQIEQAISAAQEITAKIDEVRLSISQKEEFASSVDSKCAVLENSIEHNKETIERINRDKNMSAETREQLEKEIAGEEKLIEQIKRIAAEKRQKLAQVEQKLESAKNEGSSLDRETATLSLDIANLTKQLADCRVNESTVQSSIEEIRSRSQFLALSLSQRESNITTLEDEKNKAATALKECEQQIISISNTVSGLTLIYDGRASKADKLKRQIDDLAFEAQHISSKAKMLEDLEKNMEGYSGSVKSVMKEASKGSLEGICGTVSQLISTDEDYAVAIETALGNAVQNIICKSDSDAKRAIAFLKRTGAGRATFQPINAVKGRTLDERGLDTCEGYVGIASELVDTDDDYRQIIASLLGRTVIAEDINYAVNIAKKYKYHFKIVTLDGQVINAGGSMTGGSQVKNAGILSRGMEIDRLNEKYNKIKADLDSMRLDYDKLDKSLAAEEAKLTKAKNELAAYQEEKIRLEGEKRLADEQYMFAKQGMSELQSELDGLEKRIESLSLTYNEAKAQVEKLTAQIAENESRLEALDSQRDELSRSNESIQSKISKLRFDLHDADKDLQTRTQSMNLLKARLVSHEDRDKELDEEIEQIKLKNEQIRQEIVSLQQEAKRLREECETMKHNIVLLQKERADFEEKSGKLRTSERTKSAEREKLSGEKARLEERRQTMAAEYDETVNKLYDEYQLTKREAEQTAEKTSDPVGTRKRLVEIKNKIRSLGSVNVGAIDEYKEVSERYEFMSTQLSDVEKSKTELTKLISELTDKMSKQFREQFNKINTYFGETFKELFGGGKAEILLTDPTDVLESEIDIKLQPPGKNVKRLDSLSGGEKGLSAISLLFAILKVNPAPFCIFDEVEAALDDVNVTRYAQYVRRMTGNTQFILITHRRGTMEEADMLYGITMQEQGVSKLLELKTAELAEKLGITN